MEPHNQSWMWHPNILGDPNQIRGASVCPGWSRLDAHGGQFFILSQEEEGCNNTPSSHHNHKLCASADRCTWNRSLLKGCQLLLPLLLFSGQWRTFYSLGTEPGVTHMYKWPVWDPLELGKACSNPLLKASFVTRNRIHRSNLQIVARRRCLIGGGWLR